MRNAISGSLRLTLSLFVLIMPGEVKSYSAQRTLVNSTLYLPLILRNYPCYSVEIKPTDVTTTEYRFKCLPDHFMTLIDKNSTLILRPHPGKDLNGRGSSWYAQPFLAGATLKNTVVKSVVAHPDRIHVNASGKVSRGTNETFGTWDTALDFTYDAAAKKISGTGVYSVTLAGPLSVGMGDLNLYKIASNYLDEVPLLSGGIGDTGDMVSATVTINSSPSFFWMPPADSCPQSPAQKLSVDVSGAYNNVKTDPPIQPAYKPSLKVVLSDTQSASTPMFFCGIYDETKNNDFAADNVGVHAIVHQGTTQTGSLSSLV